MKKPIQLDEDVRRVLSAATVDGNVVRLTGQLDRKLYQRVNDALEALGGVWNKKMKGHVFDLAQNVDLRERLGVASVEGQVAHPNPFSFVPTPPALAERCIEELAVTPSHRLLEPNVGHGALVDPHVCKLGLVLGTDRLLLVEKDERHLPVLRKKGYGMNVVVGDFLELGPSTLGTFDRIVMNPPFENEADARHINHALDLLRPGGRLVAIASGGLVWRESRKLTKAVRGRIQAWGGRFEDLPEDTFKESGVSVRTVLVVVDRPAA